MMLSGPLHVLNIKLYIYIKLSQIRRHRGGVFVFLIDHLNDLRSSSYLIYISMDCQGRSRTDKIFSFLILSYLPPQLCKLGHRWDTAK